MNIITSMSNILAIFTQNPTIESATLAHKLVFAFYVLSLIATLVLTVLLWRASNKAQDVVMADAEAKISAARAEASKANEAIKKADIKIAEINLSAEEVKENAAKAVFETETIKKENIALRSNLEKSITDAAVEKQKLAKMQIEVADAHRKQAEAEKSLEKLRLRIRPRTLSQQQQVDMANLLSQFSGQQIFVHYLTADQDTKELSELILNTLHSSNWKVIQSFTGITNVPAYGIIIEAGPTSAANALTSSLRKAGLQVKLKPSSDTHKIYLSIGLKPIE